MPSRLQISNMPVAFSHSFIFHPWRTSLANPAPSVSSFQILPGANSCRVIAACPACLFSTSPTFQLTGGKRVDRRLDAYRAEQARQRKVANKQRRVAVEKQRLRAMGDPVRSRPTPFTESLKEVSGTAPSKLRSSYRNFLLEANELDRSLEYSKHLTEPLPEEFEESDGTLKKEKLELHAKAHENATRALESITSLDIGSSKDRALVNVQRCIEEFGRHNTDAVLKPRISGLPESARADEAEAAPLADAQITKDVALKAAQEDVARISHRIEASIRGMRFSVAAVQEAEKATVEAPKRSAIIWQRKRLAHLQALAQDLSGAGGTVPITPQLVEEYLGYSHKDLQNAKKSVQDARVALSLAKRNFKIPNSSPDALRKFIDAVASGTTFERLPQDGTPKLRKDQISMLSDGLDVHLFEIELELLGHQLNEETLVARKMDALARTFIPVMHSLASKLHQAKLRSTYMPTAEHFPLFVRLHEISTILEKIETGVEAILTCRRHFFGLEMATAELGEAQAKLSAIAEADVQTFIREPPPVRAGLDTGSSEVQVAILTSKINAMADRLHRKDKHNKRNLRLLVHKRQKLLAYLRRKERGGPRWQNLVEKLGINDAMWRGEISL